MHKHINSPQNPLIKEIALLLAKPRERRQRGLFVAEGLREVALALANGFEAAHLLFDPATTPGSYIEILLANAQAPPAEVLSVSPPVFQKIAYRHGVPNAVAVFKTPGHKLPTGDCRLVLVLQGIEKPGNFGAMLRTADAAGVDAVLLCEPELDVFNPNAIRASLGAVFTLSIFVMTSEAAVAWLRSQHIRIFATWLEAAKPLYECGLSSPTALVLGAEATGLSPYWVEQADERIIIPMSGQVDSLNVANSAAIVLFEAVRQRMEVKSEKWA